MNAHAFADDVISGAYDEALGIELDTFAPGDVVQLLTGSPLMTVLSVCDCGSIETAFYDDHKGMNIDSYPEEALVHWDGEDA